MLAESRTVYCEKALLPQVLKCAPMLILGVESSCDETGIALYDSDAGLLSHALHSQVAMHADYGGVVPELASRDHIRRVVPLLREALEPGAGKSLADVDAVAYTRGPGLAGALLVGCAFAEALAVALDIADDSGASPRRAPAVAAVVGRSAELSVRRAAGFRRPYAVDAGDRRR
jgi:hypothetical protein